METIKQLDGYHTLQSASEQLGTSYPALYQWARRHHVPLVRMGGLILVRLEDLAGMKVRGQQGKAEETA